MLRCISISLNPLGSNIRQSRTGCWSGPSEFKQSYGLPDTHLRLLSSKPQSSPAGAFNLADNRESPVLCFHCCWNRPPNDLNHAVANTSKCC
jgi:hypothetical protein